MDRKREILALMPALIRLAGYPKIDLHGKTRDEAERIIDRLSLSDQIVEIVTGHGRGIMKSVLRELQPVYHYKILGQAPNSASFIVDFT